MKKLYVLPPLFACLVMAVLAACSEADPPKPPKVEPISVNLLLIEPQTKRENYSVAAILKGVEEAVVTSYVTGEIKEFYVREGDHVEKGKIMALVEPADYRLELRKAEALESGKRKTYERIKSLYEKKAASKAEFDAAETDYRLAATALDVAKLNLDRTRIESPISGQVTKRNSVIGESVKPGTVLFMIVNTDKLDLTVSLSEKEIVHLRKEDHIPIRVDAYPDSIFKGRIRSVRVSNDPASASFPVEIEMPGEDSLKPGMVARVTLSGREYGNLLLVPSEAIMNRMGVDYIFIYDDGYARMREVATGMKFGDTVQITSGLQPGEWIIPVYPAGMGDGTPVNPVNVPSKEM